MTSSTCCGTLAAWSGDFCSASFNLLSMYLPAPATPNALSRSGTAHSRCMRKRRGWRSSAADDGGSSDERMNSGMTHPLELWHAVHHTNDHVLQASVQ